MLPEDLPTSLVFHSNLGLAPTWRPAREHQLGGRELGDPCYLAQDGPSFSQVLHSSLFSVSEN